MKKGLSALIVLIIPALSYAQLRDGDKLIGVGVGKTDLNIIVKGGYEKVISRRLILSGLAQYEKGKEENQYSNLGLSLQLGYFLPFCRYKAYFTPHLGIVGLSEEGKVPDYTVKRYWNYGGYLGCDLNFYVAPNLLLGVFANQKYYLKDYFGNTTYDLGLRLSYSFF